MLSVIFKPASFVVEQGGKVVVSELQPQDKFIALVGFIIIIPALIKTFIILKEDWMILFTFYALFIQS